MIMTAVCNVITIEFWLLAQTVRISRCPQRFPGGACDIRPGIIDNAIALNIT
jgi:hypothetical protein